MNREFASGSGSRIRLGQLGEFVLGGLRVAPARRQIDFNGETKTLEPRVMQVLVALAQARPSVVSRDDLADTCWGGLAVGDDAINRCVVSLRRLAREFEPPPFVIETVPRVGYALREQGAEPEPQQVLDPGPRTSRSLLLPAAVACFLLVALAVALILFWKPWRRDGIIVGVVPATSAPDSLGIARDLIAKLGMLNSVSEGRASLLDQSGGTRPDFTFEVDTATDRESQNANLVLRNDRQEVLWSSGFKAPQSDPAGLKQQIAYTAGQVLECAIETRDPGGPQLSDSTLKLYLNGCAQYADANEDSYHDLVGVFTRAADEAPAFSPVWRKLLMVAQMDAEASETYRSASLRRLLARATRVHPELSEVLLLRASLLPARDMSARMELVEEAARKDPDNENVIDTYKSYLTKVGRLNDAVDQARRAVTLNPVSPLMRQGLVISLAAAGRLKEADKELRDAESLWPNARSVRGARYLLYLRFSDPKEAIRFREEGGWAPPAAPFQVSFLAARVDPTTANVDKALRDARMHYAKNPATEFHLAQTLGTFGRNDELYSVLSQTLPSGIESIDDVLFRPPLHEFRRDPRFMVVAQRLGLLDYWQKSGKWPDFCYEDAMPYDCKREAANILR